MAVAEEQTELTRTERAGLESTAGCDESGVGYQYELQGVLPYCFVYQGPHGYVWSRESTQEYIMGQPEAGVVQRRNRGNVTPH